jgi:hypothetical protein
MIVADLIRDFGNDFLCAGRGIVSNFNRKRKRDAASESLGVYFKIFVKGNFGFGLLRRAIGFENSAFIQSDAG